MTRFKPVLLAAVAGLVLVAPAQCSGPLGSVTCPRGWSTAWGASVPSCTPSKGALLFGKCPRHWHEVTASVFACAPPEN